MEVTANLGRLTWPVEVTKRPDGGYNVTARATEEAVYVRKADDGNYIVSVPGMKRCGSVPFSPAGFDIEKYCGIDNRVDAASIAAAVRIIICEQRKKSEKK